MKAARYLRPRGWLQRRPLTALLLGGGLLWAGAQTLEALGWLSEPAVLVITAGDLRAARTPAGAPARPPVGGGDGRASSDAPWLQAAVDRRLLIEEALALGLHRRDPVSRRMLLDTMRRLQGAEDASRSLSARPGGGEAALLQAAERLGLPRQDELLHRRLVALMEQRLAGPHRQPRADELANFLAEHPARYAPPPQRRIEQRRYARRETAMQALAAAQAGGNPPAEGGGLLPRGPRLWHRQDLQRLFGPELAEAAFALPEGRWQGPLRSAYGWHLLRVQAVPAAAPSAAPEGAVAALGAAYAWQQQQRAERIEAGLAALRARYRVVLAPSLLALAGP